MSDNKQQRVAKRLRWSGRILSLVVAVFSLIAFIVSGVAEFLTEGWEVVSADIQGLILALLTAAALAGSILSWWHELIASIVLLVIAVTLGSYGGAIAGRHNIIVGMVLALPYITAGVLFLISRQLSRKTS